MAGHSNGKLGKYAPVLLRIALGAVFIVHGYGKLADMQSTIGFFGKIGIPLAGFFGWVVALVEFLGGILVLTGLYTRIAAGLIAVVMIVAVIKVQFTQGFLGGWEFEFTLFMIAVALVLIGDGTPALGRVISGRKDHVEGLEE
ncbi:MAG TPA: DoxX family protein [bacterium]|nr:DoxX family protein [bacterium]